MRILDLRAERPGHFLDHIRDPGYSIGITLHDKAATTPTLARTTSIRSSSVLCQVDEGAALEAQRGCRVSPRSPENRHPPCPDGDDSGTEAWKALALPRLGRGCMGRKPGTINPPAVRVMETIMSTNTRKSYQEGSVQRVKRAKGPDVWVYRWRETQADGRRIHRKQLIGDATRLRTKADAKKAVQELRARINAAHDACSTKTVTEAWGHFQEYELYDPEINRSATTIDNYKVLFASHILPRWGSTPLDEVHAVDVERWLRSLTTLEQDFHRSGAVPFVPRPLAPASKAKIKSRMYTLFEHAKRHRLCTANPMESVRQGSKRKIEPDVLTLEEIRALMVEISNPAIRMGVLIAGVTGLRRSEIRGLRWQDVDFETHWLQPRQGVVRKHITGLKNRASGKRIPIPEALSIALEQWRRETPYCADEDWILASPASGGRTRYWLDSALERQVRPAAKRAKIAKLIGWHSFRRSLATILTNNKEAIKVIQELLRHADPRIAMELYAQGEEKAKRAAQDHVKNLFLVHERAV